MILNESISNCFCHNDESLAVIEIKKYMSAKTGTVTLAHQEIVFVIKGDMHVVVKNIGIERTINKWEFIFVPIGTTMKCKIGRNSLILIARITMNYPECYVFRINKVLNFPKDRHDGIHALKANERIRYFINGLMCTMDDGLVCRHYMQMEVGRMLYLLHAYYPQDECIKFFSPVVSADVEFSEFIRRNCMGSCTIESLSKALNMSRQQFGYQFRKIFGETPREWFHRKRSQAIYHDVCKSNQSLKEVAQKHGFSLQANFIRYCRHNFGASPGNMRKKFFIDNGQYFSDLHEDADK